jgi:hypothetical protein
MIDHIAVDGRAVLHRPYVTDTLPLDRQDSTYVHDVSDHLPVLSRFSPQ